MEPVDKLADVPGALPGAQPAALTQISATTAIPRRSSAALNQALIGRYLEYLGMRGYSHATLKQYRACLCNFAQFLGARAIVQVQHVDLLEYLSGLYKRGLAKSSVFIYVEALRSLAKFVSLVGLTNSGALARLRPPKFAPSIGEFHSYEDIERLIAAAATPLEVALVELAFATGCRVSELARIRVEDIHWQERKIIVLGKGDKERVVFFGAPAERALRKYLRDRTGYVFIRAPRCDREHPTLTVGRPSKTIPTLYWRAYWSEPGTGGRSVHRWSWIGQKAAFTRSEAMRELHRRLRPTPTALANGAPPRPLGVRQLGRIITAVGARVGIETHPHKLRHSCATAMINNGAGIREIQELLGHASVSTTARYLHLAIADLIATHRKFHPHEAEETNGPTNGSPAKARQVHRTHHRPDRG